MSAKKITTSAPGRICLFGEHQDYLGLPVIAMAINRKITISGVKRNDRIFSLDLPDINSNVIIDIDKPIIYTHPKDYFKSVLKVLIDDSLQFQHGYDCRVTSTIPINSGTSSSSALNVAWVHFLFTAVSDERRNNPLEIARLAHRAEVIEFNESGGMMDQFTASIGGLVYLDFHTPGGIQKLAGKLGHFVLGDSLEPKDTQAILARVKGGALAALQKLAHKDSNITIKTLTIEQLNTYKSSLSNEEYELLVGNIIDRDLCQTAREMLSQESVDDAKLGSLLNVHQEQLRDRLFVSTPKLDRMIDASLKSGAFGAKLNGSGGGGCMFAYAPDSYKQVAEAITREGGKAYIITADKGSCAAVK